MADLTDTTPAPTETPTPAPVQDQAKAAKPPTRDEVIACLTEMFDKGERILNRRQAAEQVKKAVTALWANRG